MVLAVLNKISEKIYIYNLGGQIYQLLFTFTNIKISLMFANVFYKNNFYFQWKPLPAHISNNWFYLLFRMSEGYY